MPYVSPEDAQDRLSPDERARYGGEDAQDEALLALVTRVPTLRPRMLKLLDADGCVNRVNIGKIIRWWPEEGTDLKTGIKAPYIRMRFEGGDEESYPDPAGQVDEALCSAFFDVTIHDLT